MEDSVKQWILNQAAYYLEYYHFDKALVILEAMQSIDNNNLDIYKMLSYVYLKKQYFKQAVDAADKFISASQNINDIKKMEWLKKQALFKLKSKRPNKSQQFRQHL